MESTPVKSRLNRRWWCVNRQHGCPNDDCFARRFKPIGNSIRKMIAPMRTGVVFLLRALFSLTLAIGWFSVLASGDDGTQHWVTTWTTANAASDQPATFSNQTIREIVHTTIGGRRVRIRLSNAFGTRAIRLDAVFIGLQKVGSQEDGAALVPRSNHEVTFGGNRSIAIPERADALSGPISVSVGSEQNLAISLFMAGKQRGAPVAWFAVRSHYISGARVVAAHEGVI